MSKLNDEQPSNLTATVKVNAPQCAQYISRSNGALESSLP